MLQPVGIGLVVPGRPRAMVRAFAITRRMTGRDILAHFERLGRDVRDIAITDPDLIHQITKLPAFDHSGCANLVVQDEVHALSFTRALRVIREQISLHSRVPWVNGRVFAIVRNPLST